VSGRRQKPNLDSDAVMTLIKLLPDSGVEMSLGFKNPKISDVIESMLPDRHRGKICNNEMCEYILRKRNPIGGSDEYYLKWYFLIDGTAYIISARKIDASFRL